MVAKPAPVVVSRAAPVTTATIVPVVPEAAPGKPATRMVPVIVERAPLPVGFQDFPDQVREVEVSTTARAAQPQPAPGAGVATRSWEETKVKQTPAAAARAQAALPKVPPEQQTATVPARVAAAPTAAAVPAGTAMGQKGRAGGGPVAPVTGSVQIQVAAVRSAEEAQGVAAKLQSGFAAELAGRTPVIEQTVVGNLGMLYRVQVGPFASARDTESLCARLKGQGMDCRVVGQ